MDDARAWAAERPGAVSLSIRWGGHVRGVDAARRVPAVSLAKPMLLLAYLRRADVRGRRLRRAERRLLSAMIRWSDNDAASRVHGRIGLDGLSRVARAAGMRYYVAHPTIWGMSQTSARDQALLFWRLRELLPPRHRRFGLRLLATVVPSQRWGVGAISLPRGWRLYFKSGWGSGSGAADHQAALLRKGSRRVALAITTMGNGSHWRGKATLRGVAVRLLRGLP